MIRHGFAGIGWTEALAARGQRDIGLELGWAACRTRAAAGHATIQCDVTQYPTWPFRGAVGCIDSSPCPGFGKSGKKLGLRDLPLVHEAIDDLAHGRDTRAVIGAACLDERSILTAEPMRWYYDLRPEWICMEQVPSVLPVWRQYADILEGWGYSVDAAVLDAADYGLGQRRPRAVLAASRVQDVTLPAPTHGGLGQPPLTVMADVVGWGYTQRPAPTVTGGGTATGGAEPFGNGTRQAMKRAMGTEAWRDRSLPHLRPTIAECASLQGFRPDLVFHGRAGEQHLIVGNAVPPPLADIVLAAAGAFTEQQLAAA
ncbi:DNA cytosine methyltransferase [Streptomyces sp. SID8499]|uniref:DNA cytosine methyltransferase n=1 Tax=Streptomyces sp. SID8499 TaxID=2706106 RepID=UPI0013CC4DDE|nr:DNA cytosine methyltransferase [Streptomyces sp. SID8499]NED31041.1 DNA cytosine methyltransferase [Streptomyces sp. SID8499]